MDSLGSFIVAIVGAATSIGSVLLLIFKSRGENKNAAENAKTALNARIDERIAEQLEGAWAEISELKKSQTASEERDVRRTGAITRILRAIAKQWMGDGGPNLDPADIAIIEETIPAQWIRDNQKTS